MPRKSPGCCSAWSRMRHDAPPCSAASRCRRARRSKHGSGNASGYSSGDIGQRELGGVDSKDSLLGANQIQGFFWEAVLGVKDRLVLSDASWGRMAALFIGRLDEK